MRIVILSFSALLWSASVYQASAQNFSEGDLAATIALDSGYPVKGYEAYAKSLAQTLNVLSPAQSEKVLQGKKPLKATEAAAAKAALEATPIPVEAKGNGNGNGYGYGKGNGYGLLKKMLGI